MSAVATPQPEDQLAPVLDHPQRAATVAEYTRRAVILGRLAGLSWAEIAGPLGVSRQAAFKRFKKSDPLRLGVWVGYDVDQDGRYSWFSTPLLPGEPIAADVLDQVRGDFAGELSRHVRVAENVTPAGLRVLR